MRFRVARALWIAWAIVVWNVVFDHVIVVAGRSYLAVASSSQSRSSSQPYERMDDWMRPAVTRGLVAASGGAALILAPGLLLVRRARAQQVKACA